MNENIESVRKILNAAIAQTEVDVFPLMVMREEAEALRERLDEPVLSPGEIEAFAQYVTGFGANVVEQGDWLRVGILYEAYFWIDPTGVKRATLYPISDNRRHTRPLLSVAWPMDARLTKQG